LRHEPGNEPAIDAVFRAAILSLSEFLPPEVNMAKKSARAAKSKVAATQATGRKTARKKTAARKVERVEIELDPAETKAFELARSTDEVCRELEEAVTLAVSQAVRRVFKQRGIALTPPQAQEVAMLLFGD
jgi:hypothetical protein